MLKFIQKQKETQADIVTGTRYNKGGGVYGWDVLRKLISRGANFVAGFFLKPQISDMTGSYRLYKREIISDIIKQIKSSGYAFQMEIIIRAQYLNYKIEEVGINFVDRLFGVSKLGMKEIIEYFFNVLRLYNEL